MSHEAIPYCDSGIPALERAIYALGITLVKHHGERQAVKVEAFGFTGRAKREKGPFPGYVMECEDLELAIDHKLILFEAPEDERINGQLSMITTEHIGSEAESYEHIYNLESDGKISYQGIALQHTQDFLDNQALRYAAIDAIRAPLKPGQLKIYPTLDGDTDGIARASEWRFHLLKRVETILYKEREVHD